MGLSFKLPTEQSQTVPAPFFKIPIEFLEGANKELGITSRKDRQETPRGGEAPLALIWNEE